jgi:hypothetical protein
MMQELNRRDAEGINVTLYWDNEFHRTMIRLVDYRTETIETFQVPAYAAADAFQHPYYYLGGPEDSQPWD